MNKNQTEKMVQDRWLQGKSPVGDFLRGPISRIKMPFLGLYAFAFFLYLPMIVLRLTNDMDGLWDQDDHVAGEAELRIGRWFWMHVARARFFVSMDPIPLVIALAVFVAGILLILSVLRLRFTFVSAVSCLLFLSSISLTAQMAYSYMAIEFSLSFLLAILAVLVVERGKKAYLCIPLAGLCLSLSMGLYQASLGVCTLLILF
ncbi:MAG: glucosyltransferase domain-containing protein, partial [Lachnospiraceae bacterium]|nr:glucosyltransferase domain-containing protein [Lachnospiraceae bacterium]